MIGVKQQAKNLNTAVVHYRKINPKKISNKERKIPKNIPFLFLSKN